MGFWVSVILFLLSFEQGKKLCLIAGDRKIGDDSGLKGKGNFVSVEMSREKCTKVRFSWRLGGRWVTLFLTVQNDPTDRDQNSLIHAFHIRSG